MPMTLELIPRLQKAAYLLSVYLERFKRDFGVTQPEAQVLAYLDGRRACSIADLQRHLGPKPSTLTSVLDRLVARGLIVREPRADDRRSFDVILTRAGTRPAAAIHAALERLEARLVRRTTRKEISVIRILTATLEELVTQREP